MILTIKTGMSREAKIAEACAAPGTLVLSGMQLAADLHRLVPSTCTAIISFGLCGGLAPEVQIGQIFVAKVLVSPEGEYAADAKWGARLLAKANAYQCNWWSSGVFNTANDLVERAALFSSTGCAVIDDETFVVAQFAQERGIPWQALRVVSDCVACFIPPAARHALGTDGRWKIGEVLKSVVLHPGQIPYLITLGRNFYKSIGILRRTAIQVGPFLQLTDSFAPGEHQSLHRVTSLFSQVL